MIMLARIKSLPLQFWGRRGWRSIRWRGNNWYEDGSTSNIQSIVPHPNNIHSSRFNDHCLHANRHLRSQAHRRIHPHHPRLHLRNEQFHSLRGAQYQIHQTCTPVHLPPHLCGIFNSRLNPSSPFRRHFASSCHQFAPSDPHSNVLTQYLFLAHWFYEECKKPSQANRKWSLSLLLEYNRPSGTKIDPQRNNNLIILLSNHQYMLVRQISLASARTLHPQYEDETASWVICSHTLPHLYL